MRPLLAALLLALPAAAAEPTVTCDLDQKPAAEVAAAIAASAGVKLELDPDLKPKNVTLQGENMPLPMALSILALRLRGKVTRVDEGSYKIQPPWKHDLFEKLRGATLPAETWKTATTLDVCAKAIAEATGVGVVLDPDLRANATVRVDGEATGEEALDRLVRSAGHVWDARWGVAFISTASRLKEMPRPPPADWKPVSGKTVDLVADGTPLSELLPALGKQAEIEILPQDRAWPGGAVTAAARGIALPHALALALYPSGWTAKLRKGKVYVSVRR